MSSPSTIPHRIYRDYLDSYWIWEAESGGRVVSGWSFGYRQAVDEVNAYAKEQGFSLLAVADPPYRSKMPHHLHKVASWVRLKRWLLFSEEITVATASSLIVALPVLATRSPGLMTSGLLLVCTMRIGLGLLRSHQMKDWLDAWRPRPKLPDPPLAPWPNPASRRPSGDPSYAAPLPRWNDGADEKRREAWEEALQQFLSAARQEFRENGLKATHPLVLALRRRRSEEQATSALTDEGSSGEDWIAERLRRMRFSDRFVREIFAGSGKSRLDPYKSYIETPEDFRREATRLQFWEETAFSWAMWVGWAGIIGVPLMIFLFLEHAYEGEIDPDSFAAIIWAIPCAILIPPALVWGLRRRSELIKHQARDLHERVLEAKQLSSTAEREAWMRSGFLEN